MELSSGSRRNFWAEPQGTYQINCYQLAWVIISPGGRYRELTHREMKEIHDYANLCSKILLHPRCFSVVADDSNQGRLLMKQVGCDMLIWNPHPSNFRIANPSTLHRVRNLIARFCRADLGWVSYLAPAKCRKIAGEFLSEFWWRIFSANFSAWFFQDSRPPKKFTPKVHAQNIFCSVCFLLDFFSGIFLACPPSGCSLGQV